MDINEIKELLSENLELVRLYSPASMHSLKVDCLADVTLGYYKDSKTGKEIPLKQWRYKLWRCVIDNLAIDTGYNPYELSSSDLTLVFQAIKEEYYNMSVSEVTLRLSLELKSQGLCELSWFYKASIQDFIKNINTLDEVGLEAYIAYKEAKIKLQANLIPKGIYEEAKKVYYESKLKNALESGNIKKAIKIAYDLKPQVFEQRFNLEQKEKITEFICDNVKNLEQLNKMDFAKMLTLKGSRLADYLKIIKLQMVKEIGEEKELLDFGSGWSSSKSLKAKPRKPIFPMKPKKDLIDGVVRRRKLFENSPEKEEESGELLAPVPVLETELIKSEVLPEKKEEESLVSEYKKEEFNQDEEEEKLAKLKIEEEKQEEIIEEKTTVFKKPILESALKRYMQENKEETSIEELEQIEEKVEGDIWEYQRQKSQEQELELKGTTKQSSAVFRLGFRWTQCEKVSEEVFNHEHIIRILKTLGCTEYSFQLEKGEKTGKLHFQGAFKLENKRRPKELAKSLNLKMYGVEIYSAFDYEQLKQYSIKEKTRVAGPWMDPVIYIGQDLNEVRNNPYPWQEELNAIFRQAPDERKVYWIFDPIGNTGKSRYAKFLGYYFGFGLLSFDDLRDILFAASIQKSSGYLIDMTRARPQNVDMGKLYSLIETIKNGYYFSPKYNSKSVMTLTPHVVVFANRLPSYSELSRDRWVTYRIGSTTLTLILMDKYQISAFKDDYDLWREKAVDRIKKSRSNEKTQERVTDEEIALLAVPYSPSPSLLQLYGD